jgi:hypothetical protein
MKSQSAVLSNRCSYRTAGGRQCRQLSTDPRSGLCSHHLQKQNEFADLTRPLLANWQGFQTAQGVNFALSNLYRLLAANRISARRAAVLAYINSLLLRTLPAIDADNAVGIKDPTASDELEDDEHEDGQLEEDGLEEEAEEEDEQEQEEEEDEENATSSNNDDDAHAAAAKTAEATSGHATSPAASHPERSAGSRRDSASPTTKETRLKPAQPNVKASKDSTAAWPPSIPEPDPTKKPS